MEEGEGEFEASSLESLVTVFGFSEAGAKLGPLRVTEMSRERVSRVLYSTGYTPEGSEYIDMGG